MKAFIASLVLMAVITGAAAVILGGLDMSAQDIFSAPGGAVRL